MRIIPSIEFIPGKSNVGSALSVIGPDFTFSRTTTPVAGVATRVNASGLIETVPDNVLRLDYPIGGGCPAALIEPSGTNLAFQSQAFDVSGNWTQSNVTVTPNVTATLDPAGGNTADLLADSVTTGSTSHRIYTTPVPASAGSISVVSGTTYSTSLFVKAGTSSVLRIVLRRDNEAVIGIGDTIFNVTSGTITSGSGTIENYGNGWYRCTNIGTSNFTGGARIFINLYDTAGNQSYIGTAGTNNMYIWGAQLETGAVATTYIPTTTAAVTRAADVVSVSGVSGYIGQTEGTLYAEVDIRNLGVVRSFINVQDSSYAGNAVRIECNASNQFRIQIRAATASALDQTITSHTFTTGINKVAMAYNNAASGVVFAFNGSIIYTSASAVTMPSGMDRVHLGTRFLGTYDLFFNDRIRAAAIYTTRLSDAQLIDMTWQ
jgi:hypothetical protein